MSQTNQQKKRTKNRAARRLKAFIAEYKDRPCMDCGGKFPHYVMDLDHRDPTQKLSTVSKAASRGRTGKVLTELAKCDVVCANCHRTRTITRKDYRGPKHLTTELMDQQHQLFH